MFEMDNLGIGGHHAPVGGKTDDWITPRSIIDVLGRFDLDPCSSLKQPWPCAVQSYTREDNGLAKPWHGRVWMNPPYGAELGAWMRRLADHGQGTALIFARTETKVFFESVWHRANALKFIEGRLYFHFPNGRRAKANAGAPSVLVAYGDYDSERLANSSAIAGMFVSLYAMTEEEKAADSRGCYDVAIEAIRKRKEATSLTIGVDPLPPGYEAAAARIFNSAFASDQLKQGDVKNGRPLSNIEKAGRVDPGHEME